MNELGWQAQAALHERTARVHRTGHGRPQMQRPPVTTIVDAGISPVIVNALALHTLSHRVGVNILPDVLTKGIDAVQVDVVVVVEDFRARAGRHHGVCRRSAVIAVIVRCRPAVAAIGHLHVHAVVVDTSALEAFGSHIGILVQPQVFTYAVSSAVVGVMEVHPRLARHGNRLHKVDFVTVTDTVIIRIRVTGMGTEFDLVEDNQAVTVQVGLRVGNAVVVGVDTHGIGPGHVLLEVGQAIAVRVTVRAAAVQRIVGIKVILDLPDIGQAVTVTVALKRNTDVIRRLDSDNGRTGEVVVAQTSVREVLNGVTAVVKGPVTGQHCLEAEKRIEVDRAVRRAANPSGTTKQNAGIGPDSALGHTGRVGCRVVGHTVTVVVHAVRGFVHIVGCRIVHLRQCPWAVNVVDYTVVIVVDAVGGLIDAPAAAHHGTVGHNPRIIFLVVEVEVGDQAVFIALQRLPLVIVTANPGKGLGRIPDRHFIDVAVQEAFTDTQARGAGSGAIALPPVPTHVLDILHKAIDIQVGLPGHVNSQSNVVPLPVVDAVNGRQLHARVVPDEPNVDGDPVDLYFTGSVDAEPVVVQVIRCRVIAMTNESAGLVASEPERYRALHQHVLVIVGDLLHETAGRG